MNPDVDFKNDDVTGSRPQEKVEILRHVFDRFEIFIRLSENGQFRGIEEIKINEDFMTVAQKLRNIRSGTLEEYYPQDEPTDGK